MNNLKFSKFEDEVLYGISINGKIPNMWSKKYPSQKEIEFNTTPQCESIEIVELDKTYETVGRIK